MMNELQRNCCLKVILSNYKFPFDKKDWYEALKFEKMISVWYLHEHMYTNHYEKKASLSLNTVFKLWFDHPQGSIFFLADPPL